MEDSIEGKLIDLWGSEEFRAGIKGWENESNRAKTIPIQEILAMVGMAGQGFPLAEAVGTAADLTSASLYALEGKFKDAGLAASSALPFVGGAANVKRMEKILQGKKAKVIKERTHSDISTLDAIDKRRKKWPNLTKDKPHMAIAVDQEKRILEALPKELFGNKDLLKKSIDKGEAFINIINKKLKSSGEMYSPEYIKDVLEHVHKKM